jgi:tetratricopeptide (TPR) repeat protein
MSPPAEPLPLLALGCAPPRAGAIAGPEIAAIEAWLRDPAAPGTLWVHGPAGSGRTTAIAEALRRRPGPPRAAKRIACHDGLSLEEALDEANDLFLQLGNETLARVLDQRATFRAKVAILFQAIAATPAVIWCDDFDRLSAGPVEGESAAAATTTTPAWFLEPCRALAGGGGRLIIVAEAPPPTPAGKALGLAAWSAEAARALWTRQGGRSDREGLVPWDRGLTPLEVSLLERAAAELPATDLEALVRESAGGDLVQAFFDRVLPRLAAKTAAVLYAASLLPPGPSRQAFREAAAAAGVDLAGSAATEEPSLRELSRWGLLELPGGGATGAAGEAPFASLPGRVRDLVRARVRERHPELRRQVHAALAAYALRLAGESRGPWRYVQAWRAFAAAERHEEAYEVQKAVMPELLRRGYADLARGILEATARTTGGLCRAVTLGNLAIIHKNSGDYDRALEIYRQVQGQFMEMGDAANVARVLHQVGNTQYLKGDRGAALDSYRASLELSSELGAPSVSAATRIQIANVLYQEGNLAEALRNYEQAASEARALKDEALVSAVEFQIGTIHFREGRYLEAESRLKEAETSGLAAGDLRNLVKVYEAQGLVARNRREYDAARAAYEKAFRAAQTLGDHAEAAASLVLAGDLEKARLQLAEALSAFLRAKALVSTPEARAGGAREDLAALDAQIDERLRGMEATLGPEAFERLARGLRLRAG